MTLAGYKLFAHAQVLVSRDSLTQLFQQIDHIMGTSHVVKLLCDMISFLCILQWLHFVLKFNL